MFFLCHSSRLLALGWLLRRFQALLRPRRPSAPPPLVPMQPGIAFTHTGQENRMGATGGGQEQGEMEGGEHKPTRARATGQLGCSSDTPPSLSQPPRWRYLPAKKATSNWPPRPLSVPPPPIFPAAAPPPGSSYPSLYHKISWEASPSSAQRWGSTRSWDGGRGEKNLSPTPCKKRCKRIRIVESPLPLQNLGYFFSFSGFKWVGREGKGSVRFLLQLPDNIVPT